MEFLKFLNNFSQFDNHTKFGRDELIEMYTTKLTSSIENKFLNFSKENDNKRRFFDVSVNV